LTWNSSRKRGAFIASGWNSRLDIVWQQFADRLPKQPRVENPQFRARWLAELREPRPRVAKGRSGMREYVVKSRLRVLRGAM